MILYCTLTAGISLLLGVFLGVGFSCRTARQKPTARQVEMLAENVDVQGGSEDLAATMASVLEATEHYRWAMRLARRVSESRLGICEVSPEGVIEEIDGGALEVIGTTRQDWIGKTLERPEYLEALEAAMQGKVTTFTQTDPLKEAFPQIVQYSPWGGDNGEPSGAIILWLAGTEGQVFEVKANE